MLFERATEAQTHPVLDAAARFARRNRSCPSEVKDFVHPLPGQGLLPNVWNGERSEPSRRFEAERGQNGHRPIVWQGLDVGCQVLGIGTEGWLVHLVSSVDWYHRGTLRAWKTNSLDVAPAR